MRQKDFEKYKTQIRSYHDSKVRFMGKSHAKERVKRIVKQKRKNRRNRDRSFISALSEVCKKCKTKKTKYLTKMCCVNAECKNNDLKDIPVAKLIDLHNSFVQSKVENPELSPPAEKKLDQTLDMDPILDTSLQQSMICKQIENL